MAKSLKKISPETATPASPTATDTPAPAAESSGVSAKNPAPATAPKTTRKRSGAATRKTSAAHAKSRKSPVGKKPLPAQTAVSDDEIRLRAYFLAEQRLSAGIAGDSSSDWLEARRQLLQEAAGHA